MTTSGITIQQLSRDDIINAALRKLVVIGEGQTANATQLATGTQALNNIVAEFRTLGMSIWARKSYDIVLVTGQNNYVLGVGQAENIPYPIKLYTASLKQPPAYNVQIEMNALSFTDFEWLPDDSTGIPVNYKYQPKVNQGIFTVWPTPDASVLPGTLVTIQYQSPFEYFVADVDTPDFPEEWNNALIYALALTLADEMGKPLQEKAWLEKQAEKHIGTALSGGTEEASWYFQRDWSGYE